MATDLVPRPAAASLDELLVGSRERAPLAGDDGKSGSRLERVVIDGEPYVLKQQHPDDDWTMRGFGDLLGRPAELWCCGLLDAIPSSIDHAVVGVARGLGRNGWGLALLLRDVGAHLVPEGDGAMPIEQHCQFVDHLAELSATFWEPPAGSLPELLSIGSRYSAFGPGWLDAERALGFPSPVPRIASDGWVQFGARAPGYIAAGVDELRHDLDPLTRAIASTPLTFLHGDWKLGNLGTADGRTILIDWSYPGVGPVLHELAWYLALNQARLPESKELTIDRLRAALEQHGVDTRGWWEAQLDLCLLGALVQFGWEKALGDDLELAWWCERAAAGLRRL